MKREYPRLLISNKSGKIFSHPGLAATGMKAGRFFRLLPGELVKLPPGSRLFMLPSRHALGYERSENIFETLGGKYFAAGAFLPPGHTVTYSPSYTESSNPKALPLFSYAAAALYKCDIFVSAIQVDNDRRHDSRFIDMMTVRGNILKFDKTFPRNRLVRHLARCAISYGCPNAQNFFLSRYECPLPTSPSCNASCAGCISYQKENVCPVSQPRIKFIPSPDEVAEIALSHIEKVKDPIVSFGQGCEGEPLLAGDIIEKAVRAIRRKTSRGTINMNTNGSRSEILRRLFDAGLDSIRVSLNSAQETYYRRYYKPGGYSFKDVIGSIDIARRRKKFVSMNYLTMPGFTDWKNEFAAFTKLIGDHDVNMVQWRNLNFDPLLYFKVLKLRVERDELIGVREVIASLKASFPHLMMGYFNPSKSKMRG